MEKRHRCIKFDKNYLNEIKDDNHACVEVIKDVRHVTLHPFHLSNVNISIKEILGEQIAKYDRKLNGILLSFQNIKLLRSIGSISFDSSFAHIDIEAEFYVFKPEVGQVLRGIINKKSKDHVGCLVHKFFNVSLPRPANCENWLGSATKIGQEIEFRIIFTNLEGRLPYIKAEITSLLSDDSGISTGEEGNNHPVNIITNFNSDASADEVDTNTSISKKGKQKHKFSECASELPGVNDVAEEESFHRKHKRRKSVEEDVIDGSGSKKKKKSKKNKVDAESRINEWDKSETFKREEEKTLDLEELNFNELLKNDFTDSGKILNENEIPHKHGRRKKKRDKCPKSEELNIIEKKDERKRRKNADESLSDLHLDKLFNDSFVPETKELSTPQFSPNKSSNEAQKFRSKKGPKLTEKDVESLSPKKKKKTDLGEELLGLNFDDLINESAVKKKSHESRRSKSLAQDVEPPLHLMNQESKRSKSQARNIDLISSPLTNQREQKRSKSKLRDLSSDRNKNISGYTEGAKSKKASEFNMSQLNFDEIINESEVKRKRDRRSKSQTRDVSSVFPLDQNAERKKRSKSLAKELFAMQTSDFTASGNILSGKRTISEEPQKQKSTRKDKNHEKGKELNIIEKKEKRKRKADESLSDLNLGELFNESKKVSSQFSPNKSFTEAQKSRSKKETQSTENLSPKTKLKKKNKTDLDEELLGLNFDDLINESVVEKKNHERRSESLARDIDPSVSHLANNKRKRSKSLAQDTGRSLNLVNQERKRSKSQARDIDLNSSQSQNIQKRSKSQLRDLSPSQSGNSVAKETKSKKQKKTDSELNISQLNFEEIINKSAMEEKNDDSYRVHKNKRSKSPTRDVSYISSPDRNPKRKKRSKSLAKESPTQENKILMDEPKNKKRKRDADHSISQLNFNNIINESAAEVKNTKKKRKKIKDENADVSLPELNLDALFSEDIKAEHSKTSYNNLSWQNRTFELPSDSDMENLFSSCFPNNTKKKT